MAWMRGRGGGKLALALTMQHTLATSVVVEHDALFHHVTRREVGDGMGRVRLDPAAVRCPRAFGKPDCMPPGLS
jgi:hypothetical protein